MLSANGPNNSSDARAVHFKLGVLGSRPSSEQLFLPITKMLILSEYITSNYELL